MEGKKIHYPHIVGFPLNVLSSKARCHFGPCYFWTSHVLDSRRHVDTDVRVCDTHTSYPCSIWDAEIHMLLIPASSGDDDTFG